MALPELAVALARIPGVTTRSAEPMSAHTSLRVGGPADLWVSVAEVESLREVLRLVRAHSLGVKVCWPFCEWIVREGGIAGVVLRPGRGFEGIGPEPGRSGAIRLGAAAPFATLAAWVTEGPLAPLARWAGTPGGLLEMGLGALLGGVCRELRWWSGRSVSQVVVEPGAAPPIPPANAVLIDLLLDVQPGVARLVRKAPPSPGTLFAAPDGGRVEDELLRTHLAGARLRDWRLSPREPGVAINLGGGTARDLLLLSAGVRSRVEKERGVTLAQRLPVAGHNTGGREG